MICGWNIDFFGIFCLKSKIILESPLGPSNSEMVNTLWRAGLRSFSSLTRTSFVGKNHSQNINSLGSFKFAATRNMSAFPTIEVEGKAVPHVTLKAREHGDWKDIDTKAFFDGRKVVVFSLPGAFTPTCSSSHLPRYEQLAPAFKELGVDEIACISVNDGFVMESWKEDQNVKQVTLLPDGNAEFTEKMGMKADKSDIGFGPRSWRYSMLVDNGVITKVFSEPDKPGDPFEVSDADTMLKFIGGDKAKIPPATLMFTKLGCPYCKKAKDLLHSKGMAFDEVVVGRDVSTSALLATANASTVPQIFMDGKLVEGGSEGLEKLLK